MQSIMLAGYWLAICRSLLKTGWHCKLVVESDILFNQVKHLSECENEIEIGTK